MYSFRLIFTCHVYFPSSVIQYLDEIDDIAKSIQSVNTVVRLPSGKLKGYNTDIIGFLEAIRDGMTNANVTVKRAVCYGYGGVASVVAAALFELGIEEVS